ncbi:MAG: M4 family metallopeptidase, partial [Candidatus Cloacimonetes bacterium]|nr:M4 family metallopeptidase [Candidatus Cloacimonadota bacterium]
MRALPTEVDELGQTHLRWQQVWQGVPVRTGEVALHLDKQGRPQLASAKVVPGVTCATAPTILPEEAKLLAEDAWLMEYGPVAIPEILEPELWITDGHSLENYKGDPQLTWWVPTGTSCGHKSGDMWVLDALTGDVLGSKTTGRQLDRRVFNCSNSGTWGCPSEQWSDPYQYWFGRREGRPPRGPNPQTGYGYGGSMDTDNLYDLFGEVRDYWQTRLGRNGANLTGGSGDGSWCASGRDCGFVLTDHIWTTACPDNAAYYAQFGEFDFCEGTASARDVVGHEYFHAVIWFEFDPHGTEYSYEIGALEEGSCDVFGEMLELHSTDETDWTMDIAGDPLRWRFLSNPSQGINGSWGPYPSHFSSPYYRCSSEDNGGIHHNSTITSHAAYLMAEGGLFNGCEIPAIGIDAVQRIWYRAWCQYFTRTTTFNEAVFAFQIACQDLYGETHPEYLASVTAALQAAEMDQPGYCSGIPEVAPLCAVRGAGAAWTGLAAGEPDSVFSSAETVWLHSADGVADRRLLVHRLPAGTVPGVWEEILSGADT